MKRPVPCSGGTLLPKNNDKMNNENLSCVQVQSSFLSTPTSTFPCTSSGSTKEPFFKKPEITDLVQDL